MRLVDTFRITKTRPFINQTYLSPEKNNLKDDDSWAMVEMCEDLILMDQLDAKFEDLLGNGEGITITDEDQPPDSMGFLIGEDVLPLPSMPEHFESFAPLLQRIVMMLQCKTMLNQQIVLLAKMSSPHLLNNQQTKVLLPSSRR